MKTRPRVWVLIGVLAVGLAALVGVLWLEGSRPVTLTVDSMPVTATIRVGEHEAIGHLVVELPPGPVRVDVRAPGHLPWSLETTLAPRSDLVLSPQLRPTREAP